MAVLGGSGYTGGELLRLLVQHPHTEVVAVTSRRLAGKPVARAHSTNSQVSTREDAASR